MTVRPLSPLGRHLRQWRSARGMSQLDLGLAAQVSARHISFLETGKARPSREMVLRLAEALDLPLRHRNDLLGASGFAPVYPETPLDHESMVAARNAVDWLLRSHEPYPTFVVDRGWTLLNGNRAHEKLFSLLLPRVHPSREGVNVLRLVFDPEGFRPSLENWSVVAGTLLLRLQREASGPRAGSDLMELLDQILAFPGVSPDLGLEAMGAASGAVLPLVFRKDGRRLTWFTTIVTMGTPLDITLQEIRIESLFPADEETEEFARNELT